MCGIAGILGRERLAPSTLNCRLDTMAKAIAHRGPDGQQTWLAPSGLCGLAHRRLAIIDLSAAANQPMLARNGRYALTFNGEIYNYVELRQSLVQEGATFATRSDSEVLLEALVRWGPAQTLPRLIGMFAFALWDEAERRLILARDPSGEKPLYYRERLGELHFASELKALHAADQNGWSINERAISHYLSLGYVPNPFTIWNEANMVPPGHWLSVDANSTRMSTAYWQSPFRVDSERYSDGPEESLLYLLRDSVKLRLRADVPVGVFLSGGIDSGLITALAAQSAATKICTFTVGFGQKFDSGSDETAAAAKVAAMYGTQHTELRLSPDISSLLEQAGAVIDSPLADPACLLTHAIAAETRKHVPVVLNGEGADEIFSGYRRHLAVHWTSRLGLQGKIGRSLATAVDRILPRDNRFRSAYAFARRTVRGLALDESSRYLVWGADTFSDSDKTALTDFPSVSTASLVADRLSGLGTRDPLRRFMALDFDMAMADGLLPKLDLGTMAHGLEGRCPFLDHRLIAIASSYRHNALLADGQTKAPLRRIAVRLLPENAASAPKKGFELPLIEWINGPLRELVRDLCLAADGITGTILRRSSVEALLDRRKPMSDDRWSRCVYSLVSLANWHRHHA